MCLPDSYCLQNGCHNCEHVFVFTEFEEGTQYFCNQSKDRPLCDSVFMRELPMDPPEGPEGETGEDWEKRYVEHSEKLQIAYEIWRKWASGHAAKE